MSPLRRQVRFEKKATENMKQLKIMEEFDTIRAIIDQRASLSRFGDGEFWVAMGSNCSSQMTDKVMGRKMLDILKNNTPGLFVGILKPEMGWGRYYLRPKIVEQLNYKSQYYSMGVTRTDQAPHIYCDNYWELCKKIWKGKNLVIVYGGKRIGGDLDTFKPSTRQAIIDWSRKRNHKVRIEDEQKVNLKALSVDKYLDAFDGALSINYVRGYHICASVGYKQLIADVSKFPKSSVIYMALGCTATALAKDLHLLGYQALDMGHWGRYYTRFKQGNTKL